MVYNPGLRRRIPSAKLPSTRYNQSNRMLSSERQFEGTEEVNRLTGVKISSEEADAILQQLATHDDDNKKTWSRLFVEKHLSKVR